MMDWGHYYALVAAFFAGFIAATLLLGWKVRALRRTVDDLDTAVKVERTVRQWQASEVRASR